MVAFLDGSHPWANIYNHTSTLMAKYCREQTLGVTTGARELVGVTHACCLDLNQDLKRFRPFELNGFNNQWVTRLVCNCRAYVHFFSPEYSNLPNRRQDE
jgi:hypothetical protein